MILQGLSGLSDWLFDLGLYPALKECNEKRSDRIATIQTAGQE